MATIYFTNNANSGAGSLRQAVADAADGDVISPDPTVFAAGESVAIVLTGGLSVNKSLTISGGATKLTISTVSPDSSYALYFPVGAGTICLENLTVVGRVNAFAEVNIARRCFFGGNAANAHGVQGTTNSAIRLYDCVVTGFRRYGVYTVGAESEQTLVRSTTVGNGLGNYHPANAAYTATDSIVDPVPSSAGFVAPPPDALDASAALPWEDWDLRLLPTSPYATGATPTAGEYDVEGNARGVLDGGATRYAVGAYEVVDSGVHIVTTTADSGNGSLRAILAEALDGESIYFATTVFPVGQTTPILLASQLSFARSLAIDAGTPSRYYVVIRDVDGVATEVVVDDDHPAQEGETPQLRLTCRVALDGQNAVRVALTSRDVEKLTTVHGVAFRNGYSAGNGGAIYTQKTSVALTECVFSGNTTANSGGALRSEYTPQNTFTECVFSGNSANAYGGGIDATSKSQNTFTECVFSGNSATKYGGGGLHLSGSSQNTFTECVFSGNSAKTYGGGIYAETSQCALNGCNFDVSSLVYIAKTITISGGITTIARANLNSASITINDGAALSVTTSATIGAATFTSAGRGYLATPPGTDLSSATLNNVVACDYGAGLTSATAKEGRLSWTATDPTVGVLVEQQDGDGWTTLEARATSYATKFPVNSAPVRLFDGEKFLTVAVGEYSCFWRITDWATFAATEKTWKVDSWAEYLGGGDADAYFSVQSWAIDPETSED